VITENSEGFLFFFFPCLFFLLVPMEWTWKNLEAKCRVVARRGDHALCWYGSFTRCDPGEFWWHMSEHPIGTAHLLSGLNNFCLNNLGCSWWWKGWYFTGTWAEGWVGGKAKSRACCLRLLFEF